MTGGSRRSADNGSLATGPLSIQGARRAVLYSTFEGLARGLDSGRLIFTARIDLIFISSSFYRIR